MFHTVVCTRKSASIRHLARGATIAALALVCGCAPRDDRFEQLTKLAAEEVRELPDPVERLGQFLRLASLQGNRGTPAAARAAREDARQILTQADYDSLKMEPRLAGWISLAELSRHSHALEESRVACGQAETLLHSLEPPQERVQYVQSLAREFRETRGPDAAIALYRRAAEWAGGMDDLTKRRSAYLSIAYQLLHLQQVDAAAEVIRREQDRGWRAQSFLAMADGQQQGSLGFVLMGDVSTASPQSRAPDSEFRWKAVDFGSYFRSK